MLLAASAHCCSRGHGRPGPDTRLCCLQIVTNTLHEYDKDGDGKLNFAEFKALLSEQDIAGTILP